MNTLVTTTVSAIFISIVLCFADMMKPNEKYDKQLKFIFALMFTLAVLIPISKADFSLEDIPEKVEVADIAEVNTNAMFKNQTEKNIELQLKNKLWEQGVETEKISVSIHINEDNSIIINNVVLDTSNNTEAARIIKANIGGDVEIYVENE